MFMVVGCLVVLLLGRIVSAQDSPPQESELTLEPVVVSAARLADAIQELRRIPGQVYTVTADEIERTKARSVQDALRLAVPGIVFYDQVGNRFQQTVDLRGFNGQPNPSVSVFVDGVRVNDPDSNAVNFDLISIQDVERIEVLPGATAVYGRNALGGVINIITKRGGKAPQTTVEGALGSYSHYRVKANTSGPIKDLDYYASVVWDRESGFRDSSDGRVTNFTGRVGYRPTDKTDLSLGYSYVNDHLEQAGTLPVSVLIQDRTKSLTPSIYRNELSSVTFQGRQDLGWGFSLAANGYYRQTSKEGISYFSGGFFRGTTDTETPGGALQLSNETQLWGRTSRFVVGGELQHSAVEAVSGGTFGPGQRKIDENDVGLYAQETFDLTQQLVLNAAVRYDVNKYRFVDQLNSLANGTKSYDSVTPRAGLTYTPWSVLSLYTSYGQGFRVPTTDELFAFPGFGSNPDLKPIKSETYEVGVRTRPLGWIDIRGALFLSDVRDDIVFDPLAPPLGRTGTRPRAGGRGSRWRPSFAPMTRWTWRPPMPIRMPDLPPVSHPSRAGTGSRWSRAIA
jgi:iron complex outermembrane recepter protein